MHKDVHICTHILNSVRIMSSWISVCRFEDCLNLTTSPSPGSMLSCCHSAVNRQSQRREACKTYGGTKALRGSGGGGGGVDNVATLECVCMRAVSRQRRAKADTAP